MQNITRCGRSDWHQTHTLSICLFIPGASSRCLGLPLLWLPQLTHVAPSLCLPVFSRYPHTMCLSSCSLSYAYGPSPLSTYSSLFRCSPPCFRRARREASSPHVNFQRMCFATARPPGFWSYLASWIIWVGLSSLGVVGVCLGLF